MRGDIFVNKRYFQLVFEWELGITFIAYLFDTYIRQIQCRSEISEPKYACKTRIIRVFVYMHTSIDTYAYAYILIRLCLISMYELAYCFSFVERSLLISMGTAFAVKTGGQGCTDCSLNVDCLVFIPAVC